MAWVEYSYTPIWVGTTIVRKPLVNVIVARGSISTPQTALLDSGADISLMSADIAERLDIGAKSGERKLVMGVGGVPLEGFLVEVGMSVEGFKDVVVVPVLFVPGLEHGSLLGQYGFFDHFRVKFEKDRDTFALMRAPKHRSKK